MASYPGTVFTQTNPAGTSTVDGLDHALQHSNLNGEVTAIETALGTMSGTSVLKSFVAGQFPVRATGGGAVGTLVQTIVGGTLSGQLIGTAQITGGTVTNGILTTPGIDLPSSATGDMYYRGAGGGVTRLGVGTAGQVVTTDGTTPSWGAASTLYLTTTAKARAYLNAQQNDLTNNTYTKVLLDTETYDPGNNFASNKFVAPTTGYYMVTGVVKFSSVKSLTDYYAAIYKNGSIYSENVIFAVGDDKNFAVTVTDIVLLTATDYIELYAKAIAGVSTVDILAGSQLTYLAIHLISV